MMRERERERERETASSITESVLTIYLHEAVLPCIRGTTQTKTYPRRNIYTHRNKPTTTNISTTIEAGKPTPVIENTNRHQPYKRTADIYIYIYIYRNPKGQKKKEPSFTHLTPSMP